jgi:hypothetical protein
MNSRKSLPFFCTRPLTCSALPSFQSNSGSRYTDSVGNLRYYEPDFVVLTGDGVHYIVETKGLEDTNVANKDRAAQSWCENTTQLAATPWAYLKVLQTAYKQLQPTRFEDLFVLAPAKLL